MSTTIAAVHPDSLEIPPGAMPEYWHRLVGLREKLTHMQASKSYNTNRAYRHGWSIFARWAEEAGLPALPASGETVEHFLVWCLYERPKRYRVASAKIFLSAIAEYHAEAGMLSPVTDSVRLLVRNIRRDLRERRAGKDRLAPEQLRRLTRMLGKSGSLFDVRDRAMILLQFAAGWRGSEVLSLDRADVRFTAKGMVLSLGASKSDQTGSEGRTVGIEHGEREVTCPVRALRAWLEARGNWAGALFSRIRVGYGDKESLTHERLRKCQSLNMRLKKSLERAGIASGPYGSHSLRSGMVTAAIEAGASETSIMLRTGHHSVGTMRRYVRGTKPFRANPLKGVL